MKHLTKEERDYIQAWLKAKKSVKWIAAELGKHPSTIYREIKRGLTEQMDKKFLTIHIVYTADRAQVEIDKNKVHKGRKMKLDKDDFFLQDFKDKVLNGKYSPEAFLYSVPERKVCIKTLYNYVHGEYIDGLKVEYLPYARRKKKKKVKVTKRKFIRGTSIEKRPENILMRNEYGHWEMDTVYSSRDDKTCLLVLSERATREEIVIKIKDRTAGSVIRAVDRLERSMGAPLFRATFKTITCDNGVEFAKWHLLERSCINKGKRTTTFFCHPYSSYERGTNENINRMIRRWIPKGDDIGLYSAKEIEEIQNWINNYPRGIFGGLSSKQYKEMLFCM